ncbi:hypothetical protein GYMLUDRAFT_240576 [Collybiopsis luxurians FD-317 M1]|nr:hypothetical protein GYMLUDRAFT_240576 [Collybiopsis luxurians FD-317 M1]
MYFESHIYTLPENLGGLQVSANQYIAPEYSSANGMTLIFALAASAHKEQWEVTITRLLELSRRVVPIHQIWSLDCQSHGHSAILNERFFSGERDITIRDYGLMLGWFTKLEQFCDHVVVAIGHSASTSAWCLGIESLSDPTPVIALLLIEPVMVTPPVEKDDPRINSGYKNVKGILNRVDEWEDTAVLQIWLRKNYPYKIWDPRILDIYIKHGFTLISSSGKSVTTKISRVQESHFYKHEDHVDAGMIVHKVCKRVQVHCIFGERPEMVSLKSRDSICNESQGRKMASISIVAKAGHLAVQEQPEGVANAILNCLLAINMNSVRSAL